MVSRMKRYFGAVGLVAATALLYSVFFMAAPNVKAVTSSGWTECYSLTTNWPSGGKPLSQLLTGWKTQPNSDGQKFVDCFGMNTANSDELAAGTYYNSSLVKTPGGVPVCSAYQTTPVTQGSNIMLSCTDPASYYNNLYNPVVNVACPAGTGSTYLDYYGHPIDQTAYNNCVSAAKSAYDACDTAVAVGGSTGSIQKSDADMASCLVKAGIAGKAADLTAAVASGRASADKLAADNNTKSSANNVANGPDQCAAAGGKWDSNMGVCVTAAAAQKSASSCGSLVSNIGWIVCPLINALGGLNDTMWGLMSVLLTVNPIHAGDPASTVWSAFRSIANVLLVVAFLFIIFSQLTSVGITNYGVKKMLPRLIVVAILINLSFYIVQIAVDLSNIIGNSLYDLLKGLADKSRSVPTWGALINTVTGLGAAGTIAVAGVALAGGVEAVFFIMLPAIVMGALGFIAAMITLIFRQAVIPILAILAPLAFVAYLLPNTEQWFKKWRSLFLSMLMLYPTAALLFGGVQLAAIMIAGDGGDWWKNMIGLIMLGVPLFMLPFIAKQGGPLLSKLGGSLNGLAGKLGKPVAGFASSKQDVAKNKYLSSSGSRNPFKQFALSNNRRNKLNQLKSSAFQAQQGAEFNKDLKKNAKKYAGDMPEGSVARSYIEGAAARAEAEELKSEMAPLTSEIAERRAKDPAFNLDNFLRTRALDKNHTEMQRTAAIHHAAALGRSNIMRELLDDKTDGVDEGVRRQTQEAISANAGALINKAPDLIKPAGVAFNNVTGSDLVQFSPDTMTAYMQHLNGLYAAANAPGAKQDDIDSLTAATSSFNTAIEDISRSTELQARFNSAGGKTIENTITEIGGKFEEYADVNLLSRAGIQDDGKIR